MQKYSKKPEIAEPASHELYRAKASWCLAVQAPNVSFYDCASKIKWYGFVNWAQVQLSPLLVKLPGKIGTPKPKHFSAFYRIFTEQPIILLGVMRAEVSMEILRRFCSASGGRRMHHIRPGPN